MLEGACDGVEGGFARVGCDETPAEFEGEVSRGGWVCGEDFEDAIDVGLAETGRNGLAEDGFGSVVVGVGIEFAAAFAEEGVGTHGPSGEAAGDFHDVELGVAAVDAERVEFEEFARVVFIGALVEGAFLVAASVEVPEHGGAERGCAEHVGEASECVFPDDLAIVVDLEPGAVAFGDVDVEVVGPELDHDFVELARAVGGAEDGVVGEFAAEEIVFELEEIAGGESEGFEAAGQGVACGVVERCGGELFVDVAFDAERGDAGVIAGAGTEGEAVEDVAHGIDAGGGWCEEAAGVRGRGWAEEDGPEFVAAGEDAGHGGAGGREKGAPGGVHG